MDSTNKNPIFSIKNFRSFGEDGADFEIAPITILTGCNSAGKSSLVKALILLSIQNNKPGVLPNEYLKVSSKELNLGRLDKVINKNSDDSTISISYKIWSNYIQEYVVVNRVFAGDKSDKLDNGKLLRFTITRENGTLIYDYMPDTYSPVIKKHPESILSNIRRYYKACKDVKMKHDLTIIEQLDKEDKDEEIDALRKRIQKTLDELSNDSCNIRVEDYPAESLLKAVNIRDPLKMSGLESVLRKSLTEEEIEEQENSDFMGFVLDEANAPWFTKDVLYIDSSSAQIERLYNVDNNNKLCNALRFINDKSISFQTFPHDDMGVYHRPCTFVNKWIKAFGIGDSVEVEGTAEGLGIVVYLVRGESKTLLADEGYGVTQLVSLLMHIDNAIPIFYEGKCAFDFEKGEEDYKKVDYTYPPRFIAVEEPEVHLHPKFQSLLADMFVEAYQKYNIHFIIETHSEYLIRKLQVMVADKNNTLTSNDVSLNYVEKDEHGVSHNKQIKIKEDGRLDSSFGEGFYDEADNLTMELIRYKAQLK